MIGYTDTIRRWATDGRRCGELENADGTGEVGLGAGEAGRRLAVRFFLKVGKETAETVRFQVFGCGFTIAACAALAELAEGRPLAELSGIGPQAVDAALEGLPAERGYCAELAVAALQAAVQSACGTTGAVQSALSAPATEEHGAAASATDPVFRLLQESPPPPGIDPEERRLFACLLNAAAKDAPPLSAALGLAPAEFSHLVQRYFPAVGEAELAPRSAAPGPLPEINAEVRALLLSHVPHDAAGEEVPAARWLAQIIAARAAHPGHLWVAMGFFERPALTAAIRRHLPALAAANQPPMRWKRFLFRQVCELQGGLLCKSPNCGVCSDYALCFAPD